MNKDGLIYEMTPEMIAKLNGELTEETAELREDAARFDGYKRAFDEARDALAAAERHTDEKPRDILAETADRGDDDA